MLKNKWFKAFVYTVIVIIVALIFIGLIATMFGIGFAGADPGL